MAKLDVRNLTISFRTNNGAVRAVRDVSFSLNEGETLAIAGESGSGKSVTARAVMGILAGNAMVDNGEIIYDGRDLLKIPEEDFHTLRGHKLSMVFQDPLSALNPVMRVGKQLTEAMILNNKGRRRDGRARFNRILALLEKNMLECKADAPLQDRRSVHEAIKTFDGFVSVAVKKEQAYEAALAAAVEANDLMDEITLHLATGGEKLAREALGRLERCLDRVYDDFFIPRGDQEFMAVRARVRAAAKTLSLREADTLKGSLASLRDALRRDRAVESSDFFWIGYWLYRGHAIDIQTGNVTDIRDKARKALEGDFLRRFLLDISEAIAHSRAKSARDKAKAAKVLEAEMPTFRGKRLDEKACKASAARAVQAVEATIDPLCLEKDNLSHVFNTSIYTNIKRYFRGVKNNPREEKRFERDTLRIKRRSAQGKVTADVVPMNLIDLDTARQNILSAMEALIARYNTDEEAGRHGMDGAAAMVTYLRARASEYAHKLSLGMARHRALELMKEVGIPEPHKRFTQYPFEFSGGMRQRIVIAIALSANPDILICDEPTTALDVTIQAQILELINNLKKERRLSVIFITHDLGVVANMADRVAVMYAGKIVEYGTAEEVFYDPRHPYTWALLSSMPDLETKEKLEAIPGTPPDMIYPPKGDAFAARNRYALEIDFEEQPPFFQITDTHIAATWLLHPDAPKPPLPPIVRERIDRMKRTAKEGAES